MTNAEIISLATDPYRHDILLCGQNGNIATSGFEHIWSPSVVYPWSALSSATSLEVVGTSTSDTVDGTGVRSVRIDGLDANYEPITETVDLAGTTPVALSNQYLRVQKMTATAVGSAEWSTAAINVRTVVGSTIVCQMGITATVSNGLHYTVPAGYTALIMGLEVSAHSASALRDIQIRTGVGHTLMTHPWRMYSHANVATPTPLFTTPIKVSETQDIDTRISVSVSSQIVGGLMHIRLIKGIY